MPTILADLFEKSLSLEQPKQDPNADRAMDLWERMAKNFTKIATNTAPLRKGQKAVDGQVVKEPASMRRRAPALFGPVDDLSKAIKDGFAAMEKRQKTPMGTDNGDIKAELVEIRQQDAAIARSEVAERKRVYIRDAKGRFAKKDSPEVRIERAQLDIAQEELDFAEKEAFKEGKRHKEILRALKRLDSGSLLGALGKGLLFREMLKRLPGIPQVPNGKKSPKTPPVPDGKAPKSKPVDATKPPKSAKPSMAQQASGGLGAAEAARRGGKGRFAGKGAPTIATEAGAKKAPGVLGRLGKVAGFGGRLAGRSLTAIPVLGQILAASFAGFDAYQGWNDKAGQQRAFGLKEGQEATTGQKAAMAGANVLDMGGLTTSLLNLIGVNFDKDAVARGMYALGQSLSNGAVAIGTTLKNFAIEKWPEVKEGAVALATNIKDGAFALGGKLKNFAIEKWEDMKAGAAAFASNVAEGAAELGNNLKNFAIEKFEDVVTGLKELGGSLLSGAQTLLGNIGGFLKDDIWGKGTEYLKKAAGFAVETISKGKEAATNFIMGAGDTVHKTMDEAITTVMGGIDKAKDTFNGFVKGVGEVGKNAAENAKEINSGSVADIVQGAEDGEYTFSLNEAAPVTATEQSSTSFNQSGPAPVAEEVAESSSETSEKTGSQLAVENDVAKTQARTTEQMSVQLEELSKETKTQTKIFENFITSLKDPTSAMQSAMDKVANAVRGAARSGSGGGSGGSYGGGSYDGGNYGSGNQSTGTPALRPGVTPQNVPHVQKMTRGFRNNNPGNIDMLPNNEKWEGEIDNPNESKHATFITPEHGIRALGRNLLSYNQKHGLDTIEGIISRWAPRSDGNDTEDYIKFVSEKMGVSRSQKLDFRDQKVMQALGKAITLRENSANPYTDEQWERGIAAAYDKSIRLPVPESAKAPQPAPANTVEAGPNMAARSGLKLLPNGSIDMSTLQGRGSLAFEGKVNVQDMDPETAARMAAFAAQHEKITGEKLLLTEGYRSFQEQEKVRREVGEAKSATPGTSNHGFGTAFDIKPGGINRGAPNIRRLERIYKEKGYDFDKELEKFGLKRPLLNTRKASSRETWHVEAIGRKNEAMQADRSRRLSGTRKGSDYLSAEERALYMPGAESPKQATPTSSPSKFAMAIQQNAKTMQRQPAQAEQKLEAKEPAKVTAFPQESVVHPEQAKTQQARQRDMAAVLPDMNAPLPERKAPVAKETPKPSTQPQAPVAQEAPKPSEQPKAPVAGEKVDYSHELSPDGDLVEMIRDTKKKTYEAYHDDVFKSRGNSEKLKALTEQLAVLEKQAEEEKASGKDSSATRAKHAELYSQYRDLSSNESADAIAQKEKDRANALDERAQRQAKLIKNNPINEKWTLDELYEQRSLADSNAFDSALAPAEREKWRNRVEELSARIRQKEEKEEQAPIATEQSAASQSQAGAATAESAMGPDVGMSGGEGGTAQAEQPRRQPAQASYRRPTPEVKMTERREQPMMLTDPAFKEMVNLLAQQLDVQKKQLEKGEKKEDETPEIATDFRDPHAREMAAM